MEKLQEKYIELLLGRCLSIKASKILFVNYDKMCEPFVEAVVKKAKEMGFDDIYLDQRDVFLTHEKLKHSSMEEIEKDPYFNREIWDEYAKKGTNFLMLDTEFPGVMDDIEPEKIDLVAKITRETRSVFRNMEINYQIPWVIAAVPNEIWAKDIFPNSENPFEDLFLKICDMCMVTTTNPTNSWNEYIRESEERVKWLNSLRIKSLHYKNSIGTDLTIYLPEDHIWLGPGSHGEYLVNMPSYEIFTSPDYRKTEGIVYSSKPLFYAGGEIKDFFLEFKDGKVINFGAKKGYELLKGIIEGEPQSSFLGEVALVNYDSPISNTGLVFGTTLFDENASCHLALGCGFPKANSNTEGKTSEELLALGVNVAVNHVDFMIGTSDLMIEADLGLTRKLIFKNGNFIK